MTFRQGDFQGRRTPKVVVMLKLFRFSVVLEPPRTILGLTNRMQFAFCCGLLDGSHKAPLPEIKQAAITADATGRQKLLITAVQQTSIGDKDKSGKRQTAKSF